MTKAVTFFNSEKIFVCKSQINSPYVMGRGMRGSCNSGGLATWIPLFNTQGERHTCLCSISWWSGDTAPRQQSVSLPRMGWHPIWLFSVCGNPEMRVWGTSTSTLESQTSGTGSCITGGEKTFQVALIFSRARSGVSCTVCASRVVTGVKGFQD